jgi:hypothetical protein
MARPSSKHEIQKIARTGTAAALASATGQRRAARRVRRSKKGDERCRFNGVTGHEATRMPSLIRHSKRSAQNLFPGTIYASIRPCNEAMSCQAQWRNRHIRHSPCCRPSTSNSRPRNPAPGARILSVAVSLLIAGRVFPMRAAGRNPELFSNFSTQFIWPRKTAEYNSGRCSRG